MKQYVVDASVILTALLESRESLVGKIEKYFRSAREGKSHLFSIPFVTVEVANGLRFNTRDKDIALKLFGGFQELQIKKVSLSNSQYEKILGLSYEIGTTVYDTSYHILAKSLGATFLTCDADYYKKAAKLGNIELLK